MQLQMLRKWCRIVVTLIVTTQIADQTDAQLQERFPTSVSQATHGTAAEQVTAFQAFAVAGFIAPEVAKIHCSFEIYDAVFHQFCSVERSSNGFVSYPTDLTAGFQTPPTSRP